MRAMRAIYAMCTIYAKLYLGRVNVEIAHLPSATHYRSVIGRILNNLAIPSPREHDNSPYN